MNHTPKHKTVTLKQRTPRPQRAEPDKIPTILQVIVTCKDESDQRTVYEQLKAQNRKCRLVML